MHGIRGVLRSAVGEKPTGAPAVQAAGERRQRAADVQSGEARAAVLGVNDGLVTNTSLILGVAGAAAAPEVVQLAGVASLIAGAGSMAIGEWVSMRAQVELLERLLAEEREAIASDPARERAVLQNAMQRAGFDEAVCARATDGLFRDPDRALQVYSRTVLGVNPEELGSPWRSAISSLVAFSLGAVVPLAPWFFAGGNAAIAASLTVAGAAALLIGGALGQLTGGRRVRGALRQLAFVVAAAGVTFFVGKLFGTAVF